MADIEYRLRFKSVAEVSRVLKYMAAVINTKGNISKYELELISGKQANILDRDVGWYDISNAKVDAVETQSNILNEDQTKYIVQHYTEYADIILPAPRKFSEAYDIY